jgi:tetratricopeptide (TPR) repeat protein
MTPIQEQYLDGMRFYNAGEYERALQEARAGGEIAPILGAYSIGFLALRCNRLEESVRAFERWEKGDGEYREEFIATWGWPYFQWYATALHLLGRDEKALEIALEGRRRFPERESFEQLELWARIALGQLQFADSSVEVSREEGDWLTVWKIANELSVHGFPGAARRIWEEEVQRFESDPWYVDTATSAPRPGPRAYVLHLLGRNEEAHALTEEALAANPDLPGVLGWVGLTAAVTGDSVQACEVERFFADMVDPPPTGTLWQVWIAAALGEKERAVRLLRKAEREGRVTRGGFRFGDLDVHREPAYQRLRGYPAFEEFMKPKG